MMTRRLYLSVAVFVLIVVAFGQPASPNGPRYRGQALPTPRTNTSCGQLCPPTAWLISGDDVIEASYGAFTTEMHTDPAAELMKENISAASLAPGTQAIVVVASASIITFDARIRLWNKEPLPYIPTAGRLLEADEAQAEHTTVFTLELFDGPGEHLLHIATKFPVKPAPAIGRSGEANYFWRVTVTP